MSIYNLVNSPSINNIDILLTLLLILGFVFALFGDLFTKIINKQIINIWNSFKYDLHLFKEAHPIPGEQVYSYLNNNIAMKLNKVEVENIKKINYKQEMKKRRKNDFEKKTK